MAHGQRDTKPHPEPHIRGRPGSIKAVQDASWGTRWPLGIIIIIIIINFYSATICSTIGIQVRFTILSIYTYIFRYIVKYSYNLNTYIYINQSMMICHGQSPQRQMGSSASLQLCQESRLPVLPRVKSGWGECLHYTRQEGTTCQHKWPPSPATLTSNSLQLSSRTGIRTHVLSGQRIQN